MTDQQTSKEMSEDTSYDPTYGGTMAGSLCIGKLEVDHYHDGDVGFEIDERHSFASAYLNKEQIQKLVKFLQWTLKQEVIK